MESGNQAVGYISYVGEVSRSVRNIVENIIKHRNYKSDDDRRSTEWYGNSFNDEGITSFQLTLSTREARFYICVENAQLVMSACSSSAGSGAMCRNTVRISPLSGILVRPPSAVPGAACRHGSRLIHGLRLDRCC